MFRGLVERIWPNYTALCESLNVPVMLMPLLLLFCLLYIDLKYGKNYKERNFHQKSRLIVIIFNIMMGLILISLELMGKI